MSHAAHITGRTPESLRAGSRFCICRSDWPISSARRGRDVAVSRSLDQVGVVRSEEGPRALPVGDGDGSCSNLIKLSNFDFLSNCLKTGKLIKVVQVAHQFSESFRTERVNNFETDS
jgi:hypothetical protein